MVLVVAAAQEVFCGKGGHAGHGAAFIRIARGLLASVVGEGHLADALVVVAGELRRVVPAYLLSPHHVASSLLQHPCHLAAPQLLLGYFRALLVFATAGVEVVTVVEGGVGGEGVAIFVAAVVLAGVEAGVQGAGAILVTYKSAHAFSACTGAVD